jgi:hypothetical protein
MKRELAWLSALLFAASSAIAQTPEFPSNAPQGPAGPDASERPADVGTGFFYSAIDAYAMNPFNDGFQVFRGFVSRNLYCAAGSTDSRSVGQIILPHGVDIAAVRVWGHDISGTDNIQIQLISSCLPDFAAAYPTLTVLSTATSSGSPDQFSVVATGLPAGTNLIDNQSCAYRVEARHGPNDSTCNTGLAFSKLRIQWSRSIPVAPAVASFADVPTGAQFFAEVEALANTGITAGCTASNFCPENPVTRRQMAAFFARAFGLQPGNIPDPANP